jgi:hypothetical protein
VHDEWAALIWRFPRCGPACAARALEAERGADAKPQPSRSI